jgi:hypothetical protein
VCLDKRRRGGSQSPCTDCRICNCIDAEILRRREAATEWAKQENIRQQKAMEKAAKQKIAKQEMMKQEVARQKRMKQELAREELRMKCSMILGAFQAFFHTLIKCWMTISGFAVPVWGTLVYLGRE